MKSNAPILNERDQFQSCNDMVSPFWYDKDEDNIIARAKNIGIPYLLTLKEAQNEFNKRMLNGW